MKRLNSQIGLHKGRGVHCGTLAMIGAVLLVVLPFPRHNHDYAMAQSRSRSGFDYQRGFRERQAKLTIQGSDSCKSCHDSSANKYRAAEGGGREVRAEWDDWYDNGKGVHAHTYLQTLSTDPRSKRMAVLLSRYDNLGDDPTRREDCLSCHSYGYDLLLLKPEIRRNLLRDGVGCEACHGRAQNWEGVHANPPWCEKTPPGKKFDLGMYDTRDLVRLAEKCLECHLGIRDRRVSHRLMGAGHPDMSFELATDLSQVPAHWNWHRLRLPSEKGDWYFVRLWAVGQAVELRETMRQLQQFTPGTPDFAFFDCYACHHNFLETPSRAPGVRPLPRSLGEPAWGETSCVVSRQIVAVVWPEARERFDNAVAKMRSSLRFYDTDWAEVSRAAAQLEDLSNQLIEKTKNRSFDKIATVQLLVGITGDAEYILGLGPMGGDHVYRAIKVLYRAGWSEEDQLQTNKKVLGAIERLKQLVYSEYGSSRVFKIMLTPTLRRFDPDEFRGVMQDLNRLFLASLEAAKASSEGSR